MRLALAMIAILPMLMPPGVCVCQFAPVRTEKRLADAVCKSTSKCDCCHDDHDDGDQDEDADGSGDHRERGCPAEICLAVVGQTLATPSGDSDGCFEFDLVPVAVCLIADPVSLATPFDDGSPSPDGDVPLYTRLSRLTI